MREEGNEGAKKRASCLMPGKPKRERQGYEMAKRQSQNRGG